MVDISSFQIKQAWQNYPHLALQSRRRNDRQTKIKWENDQLMTSDKLAQASLYGKCPLPVISGQTSLEQLVSELLYLLAAWMGSAVSLVKSTETSRMNRKMRCNETHFQASPKEKVMPRLLQGWLHGKTEVRAGKTWVSILLLPLSDGKAGFQPEFTSAQQGMLPASKRGSKN